MPGAGRVAIGSIAGAIVAAGLAPLTLRFFSVPAGGVGFVTVHQYPKGWDYAVVAMLFGGAFLGGLLTGRKDQAGGMALAHGDVKRGASFAIAAVVFLVMLFAHDYPYAFMDPFHEGEHLTPAMQLKMGQRPYRDIFFLHGLGTDGGLDALVLGDPPSPRRVRRMYTVLNAAAVALIVAIAAEVCATWWGVAAAALLSFAALGAGQVKTFPYFRLAPVLIAAWALLRFSRNGRLLPLFTAFAASTLGILWSLDTGTYALAATLVLFALRGKPKGAEIAVVAVALVLPLVVLLAVRADIGRFFIDSFVILPRAIDAVWSLPAPPWRTFEGFRYFVPVVFYGFLLAFGRRHPHIAIIAIHSIVLFRTAAGRVSWSHTRYAMPLIGIAVAAFLLEPLIRRRAWAGALVVALPALLLFEVGPNVRDGAKMIAEWPERQRHEGLVRYPLRTGKGLYTYESDAADLAALNGLLAGADFLDFSGERALYYLLDRKPPLRCPDINMLSNPTLLAEAMAELNARPPAYVVVEGTKVFREFDGVPHEVRVPELARWIESNYPRRIQVGRFVVAARP
jgi:hypothetical protein